MNDPTLAKMFDAFDENDLALVVRQVARRAVILRQDMPDIGFWHSALTRFSKMITAPTGLNQSEIDLIISGQKTKATIALRNRIGISIAPAKQLVEEWMAYNENIIKAAKQKDEQDGCEECDNFAMYGQKHCSNCGKEL